jgi:hypothetical protein
MRRTSRTEREIYRELPPQSISQQALRLSSRQIAGALNMSYFLDASKFPPLYGDNIKKEIKTKGGYYLTATATATASRPSQARNSTLYNGGSI